MVTILPEAVLAPGSGLALPVHLVFTNNEATRREQSFLECPASAVPHCIVKIALPTSVRKIKGFNEPEVLQTMDLLRSTRTADSRNRMRNVGVRRIDDGDC